MTVVQCPECDADVGVGDLSPGSDITVECPNCFTELFVYYQNEQLVVEPLEKKHKSPQEFEEGEVEEEAPEEEW